MKVGLILLLLIWAVAPAWAETTVEFGSDEVIVVVFDASVTQQETVNFRFKVSAFGNIDKVVLNGVPLVQPRISSDEIDYVIRLQLEPGENEFVIEAWSESGFYQKTWTIFRETEDVRFIQGPRMHWNWVTLLERSWDTNVSNAPESGEVLPGSQWRLTLVPRWSYRVSYWTELVVQGLLTQNAYDDAALNPYESQMLQLSTEVKQGELAEGQWRLKWTHQEVAVNSTRSTLQNAYALGWEQVHPRWTFQTEAALTQAQATASNPEGMELSWQGGVTWTRGKQLVSGTVSVDRGTYEQVEDDYAGSQLELEGRLPVAESLQASLTTSFASKRYPVAVARNQQLQGLGVTLNWRYSNRLNLSTGLTREATLTQGETDPEEEVAYGSSLVANWSLSPAVKLKAQLASTLNRSSLENGSYEKWTWGGTLIWIL